VPVVSFASIVRPTTTGTVVPSRPVFASAFASCLKPASAMATGVSTFCCGVRAGASTTSVPVACIARRDCNCAGKRRNGRSRRSGARTAAPRGGDRGAARPANDCWSMDFLSDQLFDGRKIRVLTIVDNFTRVSPAIDVRLSYRGADVVATLERIASVYGRPKRICVDNGPEFISKELDLWAWLHGVELDFSRPGKPTDNAFAESFNGRFREECLNAYWFLSLDDARLKCEAWRRDYNEVRPHSAIGNQTPVARAFASGHACLT
jgi:putative transposase